MTGPIKPPSGPKGVIPTGVERARSTDRADAFDDALSTRETAETAKANRVGVAAELQTGHINGAEAIERLVSEALQSPLATQLSEAGRRDLEAHLRTSLEDDPNLAALVATVKA